MFSGVCSQRYRLQILCGLYAGVLIVGLILAVTLSQDSQWMTWSLSRLGERATNRASALAFNLSVLCASIILAMIGVGMAQRYRQLKQSRAAQVASWLMMVLALCMAGVALFPNDTMHTAHFVASRGVVAMMILLMVALPLSLGYLTKRERSMSLSFPILVGLLAIEGYLLKSFWFVLIEVILGCARQYGCLSFAKILICG